MMTDDLKQTHPHPMPGWIAVVPLPDVEATDEPERCPDCGLIHPKNGEHAMSLADLFGMNRTQGVIKGLVVEIGEGLPEHLIPFSRESIVTFLDGTGIPIEDALFMQAGSVIAWAEP